MKSAIVILSDPKAGSEESLGRLFNGLAAAYDFKHAGDEVKILFQGAGTRWIGEVTKEDHPAHALYEAVKDKVEGVSCGCAAVFGATDSVVASGLSLIRENAVPGTDGLPSFRKLTENGYQVFNF